ncbi:MAG: UbiD family decarboxylase [Leptospiraceae bacterium]|nr:UbiD family decarboxylase [Leptospiraceae bacterium]MDW8306253.1 UbiD family decarboxylase [Leptospiraceae bacterium]
MNNSPLESALALLQEKKELVVIEEEIDPYLELAALQRLVFKLEGPAILFKNVKKSRYPVVVNLFGTKRRALLLLEPYLEDVQAIIAGRISPQSFLLSPQRLYHLLRGAMHIWPLPQWRKGFFVEVKLSDLPQIQSWPQDGGPFITLPQVYSEDPARPGIFHSNLGMYRVQLAGNAYLPQEEVGLHYQLHRGIGIHHTHALMRGERLKVSIFVGGHPAHMLAAVMPLPEGLSELMFAGVLAGRNFRYFYEMGQLVSADADFVILGDVGHETKPEGPFGDHLGYYSLMHDFPVMKVKKVLARKGAIWPFTSVGRPPQEDTVLGELIHEITSPMVSVVLPGVHAVHAVDRSGVHPLLLALGSERYTPYQKERSPQEILTQAMAILGFNQMSLAKYLMIMPKEDVPMVSVYDTQTYLFELLSRIDWQRDLHFITRTTIDTLDYSGEGLHLGSKLILAAAGSRRRELKSSVPQKVRLPAIFSGLHLALPGVLCLGARPFGSYPEAEKELRLLDKALQNQKSMEGFGLIVLCDDPCFTARNLDNFLWVTFTRSNPSHDIWGVGGYIKHKHFSCHGPLIIDARKKPHHAPTLEEDPQVLKRIERFFAKGKPLHHLR